jgi:hypothetical protein
MGSKNKTLTGKAMPDKNSRILKPSELIWSLLIGFHLVFQGMALPLHLYVSHSHKEAGSSFRENPQFKADDSHEHEDCPICRLLNTLHTPLAGHPQNPSVFTPLHVKGVSFSFDILPAASPRQYPSRAPPISGFTA